MKKIFLILSILAGTIFLASCGNDTDNNIGQKQTSTGKTVISQVATGKTLSGGILVKKNFSMNEGVLDKKVSEFLKSKNLNDVTVQNGLYSLKDKKYEPLLAFINYPGRTTSSIEDNSGNILVFNKNYEITDSISQNSKEMLLNYMLMGQLISVTDTGTKNINELMLKKGIYYPTNTSWTKFMVDNKIEDIYKAVKLDPSSKSKYLEYVKKKMKDIQDKMQEDKKAFVGRNVIELFK